MSDELGTERYLRLTVELTVEVQDIGALQAAALKEIEHPDADLDDDERREQAEMVSADETGATALQWLIEPDHVLGLIEHVDQVEPREAVLGVEPSDGPSDEDDEHEHDHGHGHGHDH
ncbi:hypothetical protein [Planomonospora venezuelensis]|uniref:Uncharacterized protein n=1 Tax=Planomonospora venezuelensis TaxID=1999 RepID=A0A841D5L1_PLAVE|nr:hypothetical protein [Planomonospora venezuelensis]MBB5965511.1 hypothetical protein [Planomonospora venezuelensis]GIN03358.1 hypothetical protein Pve01_50160 [Planomonospora venezuelensis]